MCNGLNGCIEIEPQLFRYIKQLSLHFTRIKTFGCICQFYKNISNFRYLKPIYLQKLQQVLCAYVIMRNKIYSLLCISYCYKLPTLCALYDCIRACEMKIKTTDVQFSTKKIIGLDSVRSGRCLELF